MMNFNKMPSKMSFENQLLRIALFVGLLPTTFLFYALYSHELSIFLKIILMFLLLVAVIHGAFLIRQKVVSQLRTSTNLITAMQAGDHSIRANHFEGEGALKEFNIVFNDLSTSLATQELVSKEQQVLLDIVIKQIDVAIVAVNKSSKIILMNPAAEKLFSCRFDEVAGWPISTLGLQDVLTHESRQVIEFEIENHKKKVFIHTDEYFEQGNRHKLIFITDIQKLLHEEERQAWQKLLRVLSHEINNSLTPIASLSDTLIRLIVNHKKTLTEQVALVQAVTKQSSSANNTFVNNTSINNTELFDDLEEGLAVIAERAQSLNEFLLRYQEFSCLPKPEKTLFKLADLLKSMLLLFDDFNIRLSGQSLIIYGDEKQLQQVLVNLIKNAQQAMLNNKKGIINIDWQQKDGMVEINISDQGTGINNSDNIFVPFYTTKTDGCGIGLVFSRQIIVNHGGNLTLSNRDDCQGAVASIILPMHDNI
ncbi:sensor histidine kinase [Colwellia psychrerythraea]|uniref:histidine kinase n=1 Tax=Colwellia psychrerythraea TaxID=28229 RepID=A0A099KPX9_COLPS|nr:ATP-binding protein [Colwellia psychrerythraea]KGJ92275.1 ATP-binding region ATPase domain protein [Colwellia psychrerythraea]